MGNDGSESVPVSGKFIAIFPYATVDVLCIQEQWRGSYECVMNRIHHFFALVYGMSSLFFPNRHRTDQSVQLYNSLPIDAPDQS